MGRIFRTVHEPVTEHRMAELAVELRAANRDHDNAVIEKKDAMGTWRNTIKDLRAKIEEVGTAIDKRQISRLIECEEVLFPEEGIARIRRMDDGTLTGEQRQLTMSERQIPIPLGMDATEGFVPEDWPADAPFDRGTLVWLDHADDDDPEGIEDTVFEVVSVKLGEGGWIVEGVEYEPENPDAAATIKRDAAEFSIHSSMTDRRKDLYPVALEDEEPKDAPEPDGDEYLDDDDEDDDEDED